MTHADVAVYGGVPGGITAAVAAAREGAAVMLVEPTWHVGGLTTSGLNTAESEHMLTWTFGGIAQEFYRRLGARYGRRQPAYYFESAIAEQVLAEMLDEAGVRVHFGSHLDRVRLNRNRIDELVLVDGSTVSAAVYVDASYEGDLMARAGVDYASGREGRADYGEDLAGIRIESEPRPALTVDEHGQLLPGISGWVHDVEEGAPDDKVMTYNWRLCFSNDRDRSVPIPAPQHYHRSRYRLLENWLADQAAHGTRVRLIDILDLYPHAPGRKDKMEVNNRQDAIISLGHFGGQFGYPDSDHATRARIIADHRDYTLGLLHFLGTDDSVPDELRAEVRQWGLAGDEFADNGHWPYQLYVREARRMRGAHVMTQHDVQHERRKPDAIAIGSHFIDSHHVQRLAVSPTEFVNEGRIWRIGRAYQIPYRSLIPKRGQCTNLIVPVAASFTHVAFCTYRLESTWMMAGQAAGVAALQAARDGTTVQDVDVTELQARLHDRGQIIDFVPGQPERFTGGPGWPEF